jgi:hypothetical protein
MQEVVFCNIMTLIELCTFVGSNRNNRIIMHRMENVNKKVLCYLVKCDSLHYQEQQYLQLEVLVHHLVVLKG